MKEQFSAVTKLLAYLLGALLILSMLSIGFFRKTHRDEPITYGITFSEKYASELGLDVEKSYISILQGLPFERLRLMSYWDLREPQQGKFDFKLLDWMMDEAANNHRGVTLAIGLRQPRWPECHMPDWAQNLTNEERNDALLNYIESVVTRYKDHPALLSYQLENEAANRSFGNCSRFDRAFIQEEYELVSELDSQHPIILNVSNQSGIPLRSPRADIVGFSIYDHAHFSIREGGRQFKWNFFIPPSWHGLRAATIEALYADRTFIHELQAEPWGGEATIRLSNQEQLNLMNGEKLRSQVEFAKQTGMREMYLWGAEWWYWRQVKFDDSSLMDAAKEIFNQSSTHR